MKGGIAGAGRGRLARGDRRGAGKCSLEKFSITLSAILDLPRWTDRDAASDALRTEWDRFAAALRQHKDNGVRTANGLAGRLRALLK